MVACVTRMRLSLGLLGVAGAVALLASGSGVHAQTAPVTMTRQALTLEGANAIINAALAHANQIGVQVAIVVDDPSAMTQIDELFSAARAAGANAARSPA